MKINEKIELFHATFYNMYFKELIVKMNKKHNLNWEVKINNKKNKLKKKDEIRIKNFEKKMDEHKENIYEFILIKTIKSLLSYIKSNKTSKIIYNYYNLSQLILNNIFNINKYILNYALY